ncbi:thioredoxin [Paenibacillus swuensis]|uniref:Thioredoxin n=1 Tax=Paenibacillus swuensis TaxID=1178515 RepID=A0A172TNT9_9BACL|nr:thioredoxin [Paenibacillus swuensis]
MAATALTKETFDQTIASGTTLVDFWAPWCGPCKIQLPIVDELAGELAGRANITKVNVDDQPELASQFNVMSIPTLLIFKDGELQNKLVGLQSKEALLAKLS